MMFFRALEPEPMDSMFGRLRAAQGANPLPAELTGALTRWALLYDVPLPYLAVREEMLPPESIRFFHMDYAYLFAMLDGALSPGRSFEVDYRHDAQYIDAAIDAAFRQRFAVRPKLQGVPPSPPPDSLDTSADTGFLLRSELVRGWRGLEFTALDKNNAPIRALRLETLNGELLLGIYAGTIERLEIAQPPEGLHYGFTHAPAGGFEKLLRGLNDGALLEQERTYASIAMRGGNTRVVDIAQTGRNIGEKLGLADVTSAHIALELIQNALTGVVEKNQQPKGVR